MRNRKLFWILHKKLMDELNKQDFFLWEENEERWKFFVNYNRQYNPYDIKSIQRYYYIPNDYIPDKESFSQSESNVEEIINTLLKECFDPDINKFAEQLFINQGEQNVLLQSQSQ